jgi:hypothetical protein
MQKDKLDSLCPTKILSRMANLIRKAIISSKMARGPPFPRDN